VFLGGDADNQLQPTRVSFGANTRIDHPYKLACKIRIVHTVEASLKKLDTYTVERQPIGWLRHQQTFSRPDYRRWAGDALADEPIYGSEAMELGQRIASAAVIGADDELPPAAHPNVWAGQPGTRVPHVWVGRSGRLVSTIDLFTTNLTLISHDPRWIDAVGVVTELSGVKIDSVLVGTDVQFPPDRTFEMAFGVTEAGASLVRPDAIVAWRSAGMDGEPGSALSRVLDQITGRRF
jgi:putative polyketide hydroxylase